MYLSEAAADNLRSRYKHNRPVQTVKRRPIQADIAPRHHAPRVTQESVAQRVVARPVTQKHVAQVGVPVEAPKTQVSSVLEVNIDAVPAAPQKRYKYLVKPRRLEHIALVVMAVALFAMGSYISFGGAKANHELTKTTKQLNSQAAATDGEVETPVADKPSAKTVRAYKVAADMPRYIRIPSLKTEARVLSVGVNKKGEVATPSNVHDAAWFNQSAKPGDDGAAFIDGHVSTWSTNGVFYNLKKATPGMVIEIERGDGTKLSYKVVKTETYKVESVDMNAAVNSVTPGKQGLNLMTCTGNVIKGTSEFDSRLLVRAERIS